MSKTLFSFFFGILFLLPLAVSAQIRIDSLEQLLTEEIPNIQKTGIRLLLAEAYLDVDFNKSGDYLSLLKNDLTTESDPVYLIRFHIASSIFYRSSLEVKMAKESAFKALEYANSHKDSIRYKAKIYNSLGAIADDESDVQTAIEYHLIALRYAESINYEAQIATICGGIGRAYLYLDEYNIAEEYFLRAIAIKENNNEFDQHLGTYYTNLSNCYDAKGNYTKSLEYLDKAIELKAAEHNSIGIITAYNNKAYTLFLMNRLIDAERTVQIAISMADSLQIEVDQMYAYSTYAEILFAQNRVEKAEEYMSRSIDLSKRNNDLYLAKYNLDLLYNISLKKGDYQQALEYYKQRSVVMDSVYNVRSRSEVEKLALEYETEKKNKEIELLNAEKTINTIDLKKSRQLQIVFLIAAILALTVLVLLWSRHKNKIKTDKILNESMERSFEKKLADSELQALRAQMNPHFLFNCLNSINSFIIKNEQEQASEYLVKFSKLIRRVLSNSKEPKVTLANELEALELYIEMEALRFGGKFKYDINIASEVEVDYLEVPPLIIQPYVENSIWHGLMHKTEGIGKLTIAIKQENDTLIFSIEDNGIGREAASELKTKSAEKRKSYGMNITQERLKHFNPKGKENANVEIIDLKETNGKGIGTKVIIRISL